MYTASKGKDGDNDQGLSDQQTPGKGSPSILPTTPVANEQDAEKSNTQSAQVHVRNNSRSSIGRWFSFHLRKIKRVGLHEWLMVAATIAMAISTIFYTHYASRQLQTMQDTLNEMRSSGQGATNQANQVISNMNWLAQSMDGSVRESYNALNLARENFKQDQRPYLWHVATQEIPIYIQHSHQAAWNWHFANFGRSPAYHIRVSNRLILGEGTPISGFDRPRLPRKVDGAPLPPGQARFFTAPSETAISEQEFKQLLKDTDSIELHAAIFYKDSYGTAYKTTICVRHLATGATQYCEAGNSIK